MKNYFTYILSSKKCGVLYIGVTNNLIKRIYDHKHGKASIFTQKYYVTKLVYFEECSDINAAIAREKQLKNWKRKWKIDLIDKLNPGWDDLYNQLMSGRS